MLMFALLSDLIHDNVNVIVQKYLNTGLQLQYKLLQAHPKAAMVF